jgi:hypothetical protein
MDLACECIHEVQHLLEHVPHRALAELATRSTEAFNVHAAPYSSPDARIAPSAGHVAGRQVQMHTGMHR